MLMKWTLEQRNAIAEGLKPHEDIHGVVVHVVPRDIIKSLKEVNRCIKPDAIARIAPLRRNPTKAEHHSVIVFSKYPEELNPWIERGSVSIIKYTERSDTQSERN